MNAERLFIKTRKGGVEYNRSQVDETELFVNSVINANLPNALTIKEITQATHSDTQ